MNRGRVGDERGGKETDRCPLTEQVQSPMLSTEMSDKFEVRLRGFC
jgi:hypothetical protein